MPSAPDYSQYIAVKKISTAQTANANIALVKGKAPNIFDGYFPLYKGIRLPPNALLSNKFTAGSGSSTAPPAPQYFGPSDITGLSLWLDANDSGTLSLSGSDVVTWTDKSTLANSYTQGNASWRPVYQLDPIYNKNGVLFDRNQGDHLTPVTQSKRSFSGTTWTTFFVIRLTGTDATLTLYRLQNSVVGDGWIRYRPGDAQVSFYNVGLELNVSTPTIADFSGLYSDVVGGTSRNVFKNGNTPVTASGNSVSYNTYFTIGGNTNSEGMTGYVFEMIMYNGTALVTADRQKVEGYMAWKWGLQAQLPGTHPYKTGPPLKT